MAKYIVTGATGHVGNNIVRYLIAHNEEVKILVRKLNDEAILDLAVEKVIGDVTDLAFLMSAIEEESIVIHSAGVIDITNKQSDLVHHVNVDGTKNVAKACIAKKVKKLIYIGSVDAIHKDNIQESITEPTKFYPDLIVGDYGKSKAEASQYILDLITEAKLNACILYPSAVCGPYDYKISNIGSVLVDCIHHRPMASINGGYNFVDSRDVAFATYQASILPTSPAYLITGYNATVDEMFKIINKKLGKKHLPPKLPLWLVSMCSGLVNLYYKLRKVRPVFTRQALKTMNSNHQYDYGLAKEELGYEPRDLTETLNDAIDWLIANNK